jgi:hypothetical protein
MAARITFTVLEGEHCNFLNLSSLSILCDPLMLKYFYCLVFIKFFPVIFFSSPRINKLNITVSCVINFVFR